MRRTAALLDDDVDDDCELEDKKERGALEFLNIEGDGILDSMYEVLWTKQDDSVHSVGDVVVPDTVVFKFNKPTGWYFTKISSKTKVARLHKKKPSALRVGLILKHFENSSASNCSDIVAYFISQVAEGHKSSRIFYLTRSELKDWLEKRKNKNGILQGFVDPKPSTSSQYNNCLVRCTWNQSVCLVERRTNVHALTNTKKASRYDRAETFEGDFRNSIEYPLTSAKLLEHTRRVCSSIVDHFFNIACGKVGIANMVINFKFDADTRLHLLWCESLRLDVKKHPITHIALAPAPSQIGGCVQTFSLANKLKLPSKSEQGQEFAECPFCKKEFSVGDMVEVSYHTLLSTYDEIKLHGLGESASLTRLRKKWFKKKPSFDSKNMKRETTVPIDSQCFTIPMNPDQGLLAHLDERLFLEPPDGPMVALSKAIDEWDDRQARNKEKEEVIVPKVTQASQRSCVDVPGIPWFVKQLHPHITVRDWVHVRDRDDFLGLKTNSCGFCFLGLTHGLTTEDTLKRHHMNITKKPHIESGNELPLAVTRRRRHLGSDDRRQRATGLSRLIVPCIVTVNESTTEPPTIESLWGRNRITDRPSMLSSMTGQQNTVEAIDVSTRGGKQQPASGSGSGSGDGTTSKVLSGDGVSQCGSSFHRPATRHASRSLLEGECELDALQTDRGITTAGTAFTDHTLNEGALGETEPLLESVEGAEEGLLPLQIASEGAVPVEVQGGEGGQGTPSETSEVQLAVSCQDDELSGCSPSCVPPSCTTYPLLAGTQRRKPSRHREILSKGGSYNRSNLLRIARQDRSTLTCLGTVVDKLPALK